MTARGETGGQGIGNPSEQAIQLYLHNIAEKGSRLSLNQTPVHRVQLDRLFIPLKVIEVSSLQGQGYSRPELNKTHPRNDINPPVEENTTTQFSKSYYRSIAHNSRLTERIENEYMDKRSDSRVPTQEDKPSVEDYIASRQITMYEAIVSCDQLVLLGESGSGKSTLLDHVAKELAANHTSLIPVALSLKHFAECLSRQPMWGLLDFAMAEIMNSQDASSRLEEALREAHYDGRIVWLLDGLDEARGWIDKILSRLLALKGKIVISARPSDNTLWSQINQVFNSIHYYNISPLTPRESNQVIQNWYQVRAEEKNETANWVSNNVRLLTEELDQRPRLAELVRNPLFLTLLLDQVNKDSGLVLPESRAELYESYLGKLVEWEIERSPRRELSDTPAFSIGGLNKSDSITVVKQAFNAIGWSIFLSSFGGKPDWHPTPTVVKKHTTEFLRVHYETAAEPLANDAFYFWEKTGLLQTKTAYDDVGEVKLLVFPHLSMLEFAAGRMLREQWKSNQRETWEFLRERLHHPDWREPILFFSSLLDETQASDFIGRLIRGPSRYERDLKRDFALALDCIANGATLADHTLKTIMKKWARLVRDHTLPWLICTFIPYGIILTLLTASIARIGMTLTIFLALIACIILWLLAVSGRIGYHFGKLLTIGGQIVGYPHARYDLIRQVGRLNQPIVRRKFVKELTRLVNEYRPNKDEAGFKAGKRIRFLERIEDARRKVFKEAIEALGELGDPQAVRMIVNYSWVSESIFRNYSTQSLEKIKSRAATQALVDIVEGGSDDYAAKEAAAFALGEIGDSRAILPLLKLCDEDSDHTKTVAAALKKIDDTDKLLSEFVSANHRRQTKEVVIEYFKDSPDSRAIDILLRLLDDKEESIRCYAVDALASTGVIDVVQELLKRVLNYQGYWSIFGVNIDSTNLPARIGSALQKLNAQDFVIEPLLNVLPKDAETFTSAGPAAAVALGFLGDLRAATHLKSALQLSMEVLQDEYSFVFDADATASACVFALGQLRDETAVTNIVRAIQNALVIQQKPRYFEVGSLLRTMIDALAKIGVSNPQVCALLMRIFIDEGASDDAAIIALGKLHCEVAVPALVSKLQDPRTPSYDARTLATALTCIGTEQAIAAILRRQVSTYGADAQGLYYDLQTGVEDGIKIVGASKLVQPLKLLLSSENVHERGISAYWLGELKQSEAVSFLSDVLRDDTDESVRQQAAIALGKIGDNDAVDALTSIIETEHGEIRSLCVRQLCEVNNPSTIRAFEFLLLPVNDRNYISFSAVPVKLGRFQRLLIVADIFGMATLEIIYRLIIPAPFNMGIEPSLAVDMPDKLNSSPSFAELLKKIWLRLRRLPIRFRRAFSYAAFNWYRRLADWIERVYAALTTNPQYSEEDIAHFLEELHDGQVAKRIQSARQLGYATRDDVMSELEKALSDPDWRVRRVAGHSIRRIIVAQARQSVRDNLQNSSYLNHMIDLSRAIEGLKKINTAEAAGVLKRALHHNNYKVRAEVIDALANMDRVEGIQDSLIEAVADKSSDVRMSALYALRKFADATCIPVVLCALQDTSSNIRLNAALALGKASENCTDRKQLAEIQRKLRWQLAEWVTAYAPEAGLEAFERVVNRVEFLAAENIEVKVPWFAPNVGNRNSFILYAKIFMTALALVLALAISSVTNNLLTELLAKVLPNVTTPEISVVILLVVLALLSGLLIIVFQKLFDRFSRGA